MGTYRNCPYTRPCDYHLSLLKSDVALHQASMAVRRKVPNAYPFCNEDIIMPRVCNDALPTAQKERVPLLNFDYECFLTRYSITSMWRSLLTLSGPAQRPGWPNSQLTIRNLLLYDAETWWLLVFILKAHSDQILAKLINQGGCCCSFAIETSQKFWKWKNFLCLKIVEIDMGSQFWVEKNDSGHKNSFFF